VVHDRAFLVSALQASRFPVGGEPTGEQHTAHELGVHVRLCAAYGLCQQAGQGLLHLAPELVTARAEGGAVVDGSPERDHAVGHPRERVLLPLELHGKRAQGRQRRDAKNYPLAGGAGAFAAMAKGAALLVDGTGGAASTLCAPYAPRVISAAAADARSYLLRPDACVAWTSDSASVEGLASALERWFGAPPTTRAAA